MPGIEAGVLIGRRGMVFGDPDPGGIHPVDLFLKAEGWPVPALESGWGVVPAPSKSNEGSLEWSEIVPCGFYPQAELVLTLVYPLDVVVVLA